LTDFEEKKVPKLSESNVPIDMLSLESQNNLLEKSQSPVDTYGNTPGLRKPKNK